MRTGRRYLQRPFCILLPTDLGEIFMVLGFLPEKLMNINLVWHYLFFAVQELDDFGQIGNPDDVDPLYDSGLIYILD
jgi:hypothetical protein